MLQSLKPLTPGTWAGVHLVCFNIDLNGRTTMYQCGDNKNWRFVRQLVLTSLVSLHSCTSLPPLCLSWPISVCCFRWNACGSVYEIGSGHDSRVKREQMVSCCPCWDCTVHGVNLCAGHAESVCDWCGCFAGVHLMIASGKTSRKSWG